MQNPQSSKSREEILAEILPIVRSHRLRTSQIVTKSEQEQHRQDLESARSAANTTVAGVAKDLSDLQLHFDGTLEALAGQVRNESKKLEELQCAVAVETAVMSSLEEATVTAEALELHRQDHAYAIEEMNQNHNLFLEEQNQDQKEQQEQWQEKALNREKDLTERRARQMKEWNQREEADRYLLERQLQETKDGQEVTRLNLTRRLALTATIQDKEWELREKVLELAEEEIKELRITVEKAPAELKEEMNKARDSAIAFTQKTIKLQSVLQEKDNTATAHVNKLEIEALQTRIQAQERRAQELSEQLSSALSQAQELANKALNHKSTAA